MFVCSKQVKSRTAKKLTMRAAPWSTARFDCFWQWQVVGAPQKHQPTKTSHDHPNPPDPLPISNGSQCSFNECATWRRRLSSEASWRWDATANGNQFATGAKPKLPVQCVFDCPLSSFCSSLFARRQKSFSSNWPGWQSTTADTDTNDSEAGKGVGCSEIQFIQRRFRH